MVCDRKPVIDHFHRIDGDRVLEVMQVEGDDRHYFFELERVGEGAVQVDASIDIAFVSRR